MAPSIGLNLRVTGYCNQGGRKYMEDVFSVAYQQTEDEKDLEYAFFGIFDGHGGREAAVFAKEHLMDFIVRQKNFWAEDDESVSRAIHEGFIQTHQAMWKELENWPKTASGLPSTAGTTASIAFIRRGKIYIGHVGDSAIVLGEQDPNDPDLWRAECLTRDHKPESLEESRRIQQCGGKVVCKSGVPRVVWNRPKMGHRGPVRRSTHIDEIPFLAVARSLGDLWSYNSEEDVFVVSPEPDTFVCPIDITKHRCLILGTDGCWNMLNPSQAVAHVCHAEKSNEQHMLNPTTGRQWINPSKRLVDRAIERWNANNLRADNTSVVTVMLDPPGPPRAQVLKRQRELAQLNGHGKSGLNATGDRGSMALVTNTTPPEDPEPHSTTTTCTTVKPPPAIARTSGNPAGMSIISRYPNSRNQKDAQGRNLAETARRNTDSSGHNSDVDVGSVDSPSSSRVLHDFQTAGERTRRNNQANILNSSRSRAALNRLADSKLLLARAHHLADSSSSHHHHHHHRSHPQRPLCPVPTPTTTTTPTPTPTPNNDIQCNEISSSDDDTPKLPLKNKPVLKESRLSRELSALQLDSPICINRRRTRSEDNNSSSDTENEAQEINKPRVLRSSTTAASAASAANHQLKDVELQCQQLNARLRNMERKMARKTEQLNHEVRLLKSTLQSGPNPHYLRSQQQQTKEETTTPSRSLRPRTSQNSSSSSKSSPRKRKNSTTTLGLTPVAKSPKTNVVHNTKPVMTRSRKARVLQLRK